MKTIEWDGKQITRAGIFHGIPLDDYHRGDICSGPSVSSSGLRKLANSSPAHFFDTWPGNPSFDDEDAEVKEHFVLGRATHHLICGETGFARLFAVRPELYPEKARFPETESPTGIMKDWNGNALWCQAWLADMRRKRRIVLANKQVDQIRGMAYSLGKDGFAGLVLRGQIERSLFWKDKDTGLWLKARPDVIPTDSGDAADLKTTISVDDDAISRTLAEYSYHQQGALIGEGLKEVCGIQMTTFSLVFVEKKRPHCVRTIMLEPDDLERGRRQNKKALRTLAACLKAKRWPGPGDGRDAAYCALPDWKRKQIDLDLMGEPT